MVTTACFRPIRLAASATRRGSSRSVSVGRPVWMAQKPQFRVQTLPRTMNVAVPRVQHSPWFGQRASSQTVNASSRNSRRSPAYVSPTPIRTLSHPDAVRWARRSRGSVRPGQETVVDIRATGVHHVRRCMVATDCSGVRSHHRQFTQGREISRHRSESSEGRD